MSLNAGRAALQAAQEAHTQLTTSAEPARTLLMVTSMSTVGRKERWQFGFDCAASPNNGVLCCAVLGNRLGRPGGPAPPPALVPLRIVYAGLYHSAGQTCATTHLHLLLHGPLPLTNRTIACRLQCRNVRRLLLDPKGGGVVGGQAGDKGQQRHLHCDLSAG